MPPAGGAARGVGVRRRRAGDPPRVDDGAHDVPAVVDGAAQPGQAAARVGELRGGVHDQHVDRAERPDGHRHGVLVGEVAVDGHHARAERGGALALRRAIAGDAHGEAVQDSGAQHVEHGWTLAHRLVLTLHTGTSGVVGGLCP